MEEIPRHQYLAELDEWRDETDIVKVILGVRRSGKSVVMDQYRRRLVESGVSSRNILFLNFESSELNGIRTHADLNGYIRDNLHRDVRSYIFMDEVQRVNGWELTVNSLMVDYDADIYITGSNAHVLSSELSTYLSGRYVEIKVLPFSFREFLECHPVTDEYDRNGRFQQFLRTGGMPLTNPDKTDRYNSSILDGIYNTVLLKDVAERVGVKDVSNLDAIARFLFDNTGNITNIDNIAKSTGLSEKTVARYIRSLTEAFLFYKVNRFDVKGKKLLNTHEKYYPADTGLARAVLDRGVDDTSRPLENIVFLELIRRGYRVRAGSFKDREVDFTAEKNGVLEYYQVCLTMLNDSTYEREIRSLKSIDDNYPKIILSLDGVVRDVPDGLIHRNVIEWLLS